MWYEPRLLSTGLQRSKDRWFFLAVATLSQVGMSLIHMGIPALVPLIQEELKLTRTQVGLISSVLNGGVACAAIAAGKAADRIGERLIMAYGAIALGLIVMGMNWTESFGALLFVLLLIGFATATSTPAGSKAVSGWFSGRERGTAMGVRQTGIPLGGAIAALILPSLALSFGWRLALTCAGWVTIGMGFGVLRLYQEPFGAHLPRGIRRVTGIKDLLFMREIWAVLTYVFILSGAQWCYLTYMELYLTQRLRFPITAAATLLALGQIFGTCGRIGWGALSDRFLGGRRKPALVLVGFLAILIIVGISFFSSQTPFALVAFFVALMGLTVVGWNGLYLALISELVGTHAAGLSIGLSTTGAFLGIVALPPLFGFVVDQSGSYRLAWMGLAGMILVAISVLQWIREQQ